MKAILAVFLTVMLSGCISTAQFSPVEKFTEENRQISENNTSRLIAYANGMAACGDNAACQVGVSMAFAGNLGQQQLFKPQTWLEYLGLLLPYGDRMVDRLYSGGSGSSQGLVINRSENVQIIGSANKNESDGGSTLTNNSTPYMPVTTQVSTSGSMSGTMPASEVVTVEPFVVEVQK